MSDSATWNQGTLSVGGLGLHYARTGGNKPPILLVHGMTDIGRYWSRVARALADTYDVVMYDSRGHGRSEAHPSAYTPADYAEELANIIQALDLGRVPVIGHSMGAMNTATAAATTPELISCIVLEDPPWRAAGIPGDAAQALAYADTWRAGTLAQQQLSRDVLIAACHAEHPSWHEEDCGYWADSKLQVREQIFQGFLPMMAPWQTMAARITCPALLVTGDPNLGAIVTPEAADEFRSIVPRGQVAYISGAGHAIHREQLDAFVQVVRRFLEEVG
jgi:pimeloyl-ACP methyl ester carboxylesterase